MAISAKVKKYLEKEGIRFEVSAHPLAYTAAEVAGAQHIPGKQMVKSVIVKNKGEYFMCVLPSIHMVDFKRLERFSGFRRPQVGERRRG